METPTSRPLSSSSSPTRSPSAKRVGFEEVIIPETPQQNAFVKLLVTPITIISFLLSLFLIDAHNHSLRQHSHSSPSPPPPTTFLAKIKSWLHHLIFKRTSLSQTNSTSPYAYVKSPGGEKVGVVGESEFVVKDVSGVREGGDVKNGKESDTWYWRTKQKKMMRAEVEDAFRIRKWVVGILVLAGGGVMIVGSVLVRWVGAILGEVFMGGDGVNRLGKDW